MFKLPVCPYCRTVYSYREVVKNTKRKQTECYHCKNKFKNNYLLVIIPFLLMMIVGIVTDIIILRLTGTFAKSVIPLIIVSWIVLIIAALSAPFFIKYSGIKGQKIKKIPDAELFGNAKKRSSKKTGRR